MADQIVITPASDLIEIQYFGNDAPLVELQGVGAPGPEGKQGKQGDKGKQGEPGEKGQPGNDGVITPALQALHDDTKKLRDETSGIKSDVVTVQQSVNQTAANVNRVATDVEAKRAATEGLRAATETLRDETRAARDETNTAKEKVVSLKEETSFARDAAQTASANAEQHELATARHEISSGKNADRSESAAVRAEEAADKASQFDPTVHVKIANNGSDFADPAAVRENIGAAEKLEVVSAAEAKAGTSTTPRNWTAERVKQAVADKAPLSSPAFKGAPTVPTAAPGTDTTQIANTAFVAAAIQEIVGMAPEDLDTLKEIADRIIAGEGEHETLLSLINDKADKNHKHGLADVTGLNEALLAKAPLAGPAFTGDPTVKTQATTDSSTRIASTKFVKSAIQAAGMASEGHKHSKSDVDGLVQDLLDVNAAINALDQNKAPLASPALTGKPTAPTPASGTSNTEIATAAFVTTALNNGLSGKAEKNHSHDIGGVDGLQSALDAKAQLSSPTFTGSPKTPTATAGTNNTQIASTAFVTAAIAKFSTSLAIDGVTGLSAALAAKLDKDAQAADSSLLDGKAAADTATGNTVVVRNANGDILMRYGTSQYLSMSHAATERNADTVFYSSTDGFIRKNTASGFKSSLALGIADIDSLQNELNKKANLASPKFTGTLNAATIVASGNITAYSDRRLKSEIETINGALNKVMLMRGVRFVMNGEYNVGVVAQEMRKVVPEVVHEGNDKRKTLSVSYGNLIGVLIEAMKELKAEVDQLKRGAA